MAKLFTTTQPTEPTKQDKQDQLTVQFCKLHAEKIESLKKLINIPGRDQCTFLWTLNSFNAYTFVPFCINHFGRIDEMYISSYTITRRIVDALIKQVDENKIGEVHIFVADSIRFRMPAVIEHLTEMMTTRPNITITYGWNHSKINCIRCADNYLVLEGSGNWSENAQHEQYILTNSKTIYEFRKKNICQLG